MGHIKAMLILALIAALLLCLGLADRLRQLRRMMQVAEGEHNAVLAAEAKVTRGLQLLSQELQSLALGLRGHADRLAADRYDSVGSLAGLVVQLEHVAGDLAGQLTQPEQARRLDCEPILLAPLLAEAVLALQAAIAPGRRQMRVQGEGLQPVTLLADRRALRLVLARVLGEAVRSSTQDDWIEIGWFVCDQGLVLHIADEGAGMVASGAGALPIDSRGIGLRLALARLLVQAHGGALEIEALARIGTRVTITLPPERLAPGRLAPLASPGIGTDDVAPHIGIPSM